MARLRWIIGLLLIVAGAVLLSHSWWSGIEEGNAQRLLAQQPAGSAAATDSSATATSTPVAGSAPARSTPGPGPLGSVLAPLGHWRPPGPAPAVYARLSIPRLGLSTFVVRGATLTDYYDLLAWGPAHLDGTPEPGGVGNIVIFGHVDEFGAPFRHLARLRAGDSISLTQGSTRYNYKVRSLTTVPASDLGVVSNRPGQRALTLFTCGGPANSRRVVAFATLAGTEVVQVARPH